MTDISILIQTSDNLGFFGGAKLGDHGAWQVVTGNGTSIVDRDGR